MRPTALVLALEQVALAEHVEQAERGQDEDRGDGEDDEDASRVGSGAAAWSILSVVGSR